MESENYAAEIKVRAGRRLGEVLAAMPKVKPSGGNQYKDVYRDGTHPPRLPDLGISRVEASRFQQVAAVPEPEFEQHLEETKATGERLTTVGIVRLARDKEARAAGAFAEEAIMAADDGTTASRGCRSCIASSRAPARSLAVRSTVLKAQWSR